VANFTGTGGNDVWTGGAEGETATGGDGNDTLTGAGGEDFIVGNAGADTISGGDGDDRLASDDVGDSFYFYPNDVASMDDSLEHDTLNGGAGDDNIYIGYGDDVIGGTHSYRGDYLYINLLAAPTGLTIDFSQSTLNIGGGTITGIEHVAWVTGSNFDDDLNLYSTTYTTAYYPSTRVYAMDGDDHVIAGHATYLVDGGNGNDILDGRHATYLNSIEGGAGDDTIYDRQNGSLVNGGSGNDTIYGFGQTNGGDGNDTIILGWTYYAGRVAGDAGDDTITAAIDCAATIAGGSGADVLTGSDYADTIGTGDFSLIWTILSDDTGSEHDEVSAGKGDDLVSAGYGDDADGGLGTDTLRLNFTGASTGVTIKLSDLLGGDTLVIGGGTITGFEKITNFTGTAFADRITVGTHSEQVEVNGGGGNDTISTGGSSALVNGGDGNDRIFSGIAADIIIGGAGRDIVDYRLYASAVTVDLQAGTGAGGDTISEVESVLGSEFGDTIQGDDAANTLMGMAGNDVLNGRGGNDALTGGAGYDQLYGGAGNDLYYVNDDGDIAIESASDGYDTVKATISYTLANNIERLVLGGTSAIDGTGNTLDNNLTGNAGANTLLGLGGSDFIIGAGGLDQLDGGEGSDTYYVASLAEYADAHINDTGSFGYDLLRFAGTTAGTLVLAADDSGIEEINIATSTGLVANFGGTTAINVDASALASGVIIRGNAGANTLTGTSTNDNLYGNLGNDHLIGGGENDVLDGGRGADVMEGGVGADLNYVDSARDVVIEAADGGNDAVYSTISYTLGSTVENVSLLGSNNLNATGNADFNTLNGNNGANNLSGLGGMDFLNGGAGNDTLNGGDDADWLTGGSGRDQMTGGSGGDYFNFEAGHFAGLTSTTCDRILDFSQVQGDKLRFDQMDANPVLGGDQSFAFIGTEAFHGMAGELRYFQEGGNTFVEGDFNGDGVADFMIRLDGVHALTGDDLFL
jgi:Ca2+-binding RTX toxin-like protein